MKRRRNRRSATEAVPIQIEIQAPPAAQISAGYVERSEWDDPDDTGRTGSYARMVHGYRRSDPLISMHRTSPKEVTQQHLRAAEQLRDDYEIGEGVNLHRGSGGGIGPADAQLDALFRYRSATEAVGPRLCSVLVPVVIYGMSVRRWSQQRGMSEHRAAGYLTAALDCLHDHYHPPTIGRENG